MSVWVEATEFIDRACVALDPEELVHGEEFSLYEAMLAIQIGDSKMDIGLRKGETPSLQDLLARGAAPTGLPHQVIQELAMQLMQAEATWHLGSMLPTTVFTSLYMLDIARLRSNVVLHTLCLAVQQSCTIIHDLLLSEHVCEDEDISIHTFGMRLLGHSGLQAAVSVDQAIVATLHVLEKEEEFPVLRAHFSFRLHCLKGLTYLLEANADGVDAAVSHFRLAQDFLAVIRSGAGATGPDADAEGGPRDLGFVPDVNLRHMGAAPPRTLAWVGARESVAHWHGMLSTLCDVALALRSIKTWHQLRAELTTFAAQDNHAIVRSAVYAILTKPLTMKRHPPALNAGPLALPAWCPSRGMVAATLGMRGVHTSTSPLAQFLEQAGVALQGWCHTACLNACRQRRRHRRLLGDWANMLDHAALAEASGECAAARSRAPRGLVAPPPPAPGDWVEGEAAGSQLLHLQLGFPLELYAAHEYAALYWYSDYLILARRGHWGSLQAEAVADLDRQACQAMVALCQALACIPGVLERPQASFNGLPEVFEQRFGCFRDVARPEPLTLSHYLSSAAATAEGAGGAPLLLAAAAARFGRVAAGAAAVGAAARGEGRLTPAQAAHVAALRRIAAQDALAAQLLLRALGEGAGATTKGLPFTLRWDFGPALASSDAMFFPVLGLKREE